MSYGLTANDWMDYPAEAAPPSGATVSAAGLTVLPPDAPAQVHRSPLIPFAFALPVAVSALSYAGGGVPLVSDAAFLLVTGLCACLLAVELTQFGRRQGIGAILIYGGILIWFCHDYAANWFNHDFTRYEPFFPSVTAPVVARALFYHCVFINVMVIAFRFPVLRFVDRLVVAVPEPADPRFYLYLVAALLLFSWTAFIPTTDPWPVSVLRGGLWWLPHMGVPQFTVTRSGNINYNWGGYIAEIIQVGQVGGILGAVYALLVARTTTTRAFGWFTWCYWVSFGFANERRGEIAFMALPVLGILFLKFHAQRDPTQRQRHFVWLVATSVIAMAIWVAVQFQSADRDNGAKINLFRAAGNTMFSEGLNSWVLIPDRKGFVYNTFPGEMIVRPLPDALWWFVIGPVPRALWTSKPIDQFALWYSSFVSKDNRGVLTGGLYGTTVSTGAVGYWYFRYGPAGVVEGALLYGWMMGVAERALRRAQGRPMQVLFALAFATFLFRSYRDLWWHNLDPILIGGIVMWLLVRLVFGGRREAAGAHDPMGLAAGV